MKGQYIYPSFGKGKGKKGNGKGFGQVFAQPMWAGEPMWGGKGQQKGTWAWVGNTSAKGAQAFGGKGFPAFGAKKRKAASTGPPPPLNVQQMAQIIELLEENDGSMSLGKLSTIVAGLKKVQLEGHFTVEGVPETGNFTVSFLDGLPPSLDGLPEVASQRQENGNRQEGTKKKRQRRDENAEPPPPLDENQMAQINELLQENGGSMSLGKLSTVISGLKKAQLEEHFTVEGLPETGNFTVSFADGTISDPPVAMPKVKKNGKGGGACFTCGESGHRAAECLLSGQSDAAPKKKKFRERKDPDAPVEPLDESVAQRIGEWLGEMGGSSSLGKLTTVFSGVKKAQLEAHFTVTLVGDKASGDPTVSVAS